ncbi:3-isopropylmalate dehydratase large subunit [Anaeroselena agilis]|uniref:3-isopropylmalate dehydratase large subunit n=1 Tax=Anaeroselena agilis TaxID=3063788 RepID=A0ABU3NTK5_9FIRM|nr:3-isopropylmalate dehydratase large subunit [Selenomonadales bacterium 4137-cl]
MPKTMSEKILARAAGVPAASAGDILWVNVDKAMLDDILGPRVEIAEKMLEIKDEVWNKDKVVVISDHYTPPANAKQAEIVKFTRDWSKRHGIDNYYEYVGPCHQIMAEYGHVLPGTVVLGTDSHTCMGGALGAFASGVGSTEMLGILLTGKTWLKVPETIKVEWTGRLAPGVMAKDISLKTIGVVGHAGATYKTVEYCGPAIEALSLDERMAITNMAVEMGAKAGLIAPDQKVVDFLAARDITTGYELITSDPGAVYCETHAFAAGELVPMVSCPHEVDNVAEVGALGKKAIHQAYIGSCTGGRYEDLAAAARILKGRKIAKGLRLLVSPASQEIWKQAAADGTLSVLADAGAAILAPTCGVCVGLHSGVLADGEVCISSTNRNFIGRMGSKNAGIYLGSPLTVAASALTGVITDPRQFI